RSPWIEFWQGGDREAAERAVAAAAKGETGRFVGYFPTTKTATPRWWDVVLNPILDAQGKPERLLAISRDITEHKLAADALRRAEQGLERRVEERTAELAAANAALARSQSALSDGEARYRDLFEEAPVAYVSVRTDGHIGRANRRAAQMFGYTQQEL